LRSTVPTKKLTSSRRRPTFLLTKKLVHAEESYNYSCQNLIYTDQRIGPAVSVANRKSSRSLVCADDVHEGLRRIQHQKCTSLVWMRSWKELQTDLRQHRSRTTRRIVILTRASSRRFLVAVEEWCVRGCSKSLRERTDGRASERTRAGWSSCGARDFD
jgi:hypothetical protein